MVRMSAVVFFFLAFTGCNPGVYDALSRTLDDPVVVSPLVESFVESNAIFVKWGYDEGADEYILERAEDSIGDLAYKTVYSGTGLEYADRGLDEGKRYIYRLSKRRGKAMFGPSDEVLGVSSLICRDVYRNDTMDDAIKLESMDYIANIYYYRSYSGLELIDEDWYYIDIPPLRQASVVVNDSQVDVADTPTHFYYYEFTRGNNAVIQLKEFWIINNELESRRYYFKIYPAKTRFVAAGMPAGGTIIQYRISLSQITPVRIGG